MAGVRALLTRLARLEHAKTLALSPYERDYGSLDGFAAFVHAEIGAGTLDPLDGPLILDAVRRWHADALWGLAG
jgi:hypothetical protein